MVNKNRSTLGRVLTVTLTLASAGVLGACDSFVDVPNPSQLEAESIEAERDATILSLSAFQSFIETYGDLAVYSAWFANEARVGDTFPTRNEFGLRNISPLSHGDNEDLW